MRLNWRFAAISALLVGIFPAAVIAQQNTIYDELLEKGIPLSNGQTVKLPPPTMADGLDAAAQIAIMEKLARGANKQNFTKGGISDPHTLILKDVKGKPEQSIGRTVDLYFVAKGKVQWVANPKFVKQILGEGENKSEFYTDEELKERKLTIVDTPALKERYAHASIEMLGKVQVGGTGFGIQTQGQDSVLVAFKLDPRFEKDRKYANQWQKINPNAAGKKVLGPPQPYAGAGAYVKVTQLGGAPDRVFYEYHLVFDEPHGWFDGTGALKSKLTELYTNEVRKFRRELIQFGANAGNPGVAAANPPAAANNLPVANATDPTKPTATNSKTEPEKPKSDVASKKSDTNPKKK